MPRPPRTSKSKALADAVAAWIETAFVLPVKSTLAPNFDLKKLRDREVYVWPVERRAELLNRNGDVKADYGIAVGMLERIGTEDDEDILADDLLSLAEDIGNDSLVQCFQATGFEAIVNEFEHAPLYDREMLEVNRICGAGIVLTLSRVEVKEAN